MTTSFHNSHELLTCNSLSCTFSSYFYLILYPLQHLMSKNNNIYEPFSYELTILSSFFLLFCVILFLPLMLGLRAPYGKFALSSFQSASTDLKTTSKLNQIVLHFIKSIDFTMSGKLAWFLQENQTIIWFLYVFYFYYYKSEDTKDIGTIRFLQQVLGTIMLLGHYIHRAIIFPLFRVHHMSHSSLLVFSSAVLFCIINGYLNGTHLFIYSNANNSYFNDNLQIIILPIGILLYCVGYYINYTSDRILINLRKDNHKSSSNSANNNNSTEKNKQYYIPYGGLFEYISSPNYFGEQIEWIGFLLTVQNKVALLFVLSTFCNLFPRALETNKWYQEKFGEKYKKLNRKAFIPFII
ncbi:hypothetical protein ABK040_000185 [Willaertia magna]